MSDDSPPYIVVVPRGETAIFRALRQSIKEHGLVEVIWDRRFGERRRDRIASGRRRIGERRRPTDDTSALGFLITSRNEGVLGPVKAVGSTR